MSSSPATASPRRTARGRLALVVATVAAAATAFSGLTVSAPAQAANGPSFLSSFESADPQPRDSAPYGPQTNVTGKVFPVGSLLGSVTGVTASAENPPTEIAVNLADGIPTSKWLARSSAATAVYTLSSPAVVRAYTLTSANDAPERDPKDFTVEGSNDGGATWTVLDTRTGQTWANRLTATRYTVANETAYSSYRLNISAVGSGALLQLADWDILDGSTTPSAPTPVVTSVGAGPVSGYNMKPNAGFSGTRSLRYAGAHLGAGEAVATNELFDVDVPIAAGDELSYKIFPEFTSDLSYSSTYAAVDLVLDDGRRLSELGLSDGNGFGADAKSQGTQKALYASQWNSVRVDLSSLAGHSIRKVLFSYDNPNGSAATTFSGWLDDVSVEQARTVDGSSLVNYVDTRRGTLSSGSFSRGNNFPATAVPNGFNFFTPMTNAGSNTWLYEYHAANDAVNLPKLQAIGISHEPSPWMGDRDQLAIMPSTSATPSASLTDRALEFDHNTEIARPDLYSVKFTNGLEAEVTPTDHGGVYRFQFPGSTGSVLVDQVVGSSGLQVAADGTVTGWVDGGSGLSAGASRMFVAGAFDRAPTAVGTATGRTSARYATFDTGGSNLVQLRVATSFISLDQAKKNLALEVTGRSFDDVQKAAADAWNARLGVIEVEGASPAQSTTLYSNLYRMNLYPNSQFENTGTADKPDYKYASPVAPKTGNATATTTNAAIVDGKVYVNNGFWDTYRTAWPAYSLLYPQTEEELVDGFVQQYRDGGWVARWSSPGYADLMTGTSSDVSFADAYLNGAIDTRTALEAYDAALKNATVLPTNNAVGRKGLDTSTFLGYTPSSTGESVSWGLEGLINDYGIGRMAAKLADDPATPQARRAQLTEESRYFLQRSLSYGNLFDPSVDFFQSRNADGGFAASAADFDPEDWGGAFTETDGWNFAFHAPFDIAGLAALYGGQAGLIAKLDQFFSTPETATKPGGYGGVIHEMLEARDVRMGQLGMSNQPSHHIPYLYAAAGKPAQTQAAVREILQRLFVGSDIGQGYAGDEDNGETSAWYVFSALGFYPEAVGSGEYVIGSPLFTKATVHLAGGKDLVIDAPRNSTKNVYIQSASLDGKALTSATIAQADIAKGGTLHFDMGATPSSWGDSTVSAEKRVALVDATKPAFGAATVSDGTSAQALVDDNSRSSVTFATATPSVEWTSASGPVTVTSYTLTNGASGAAPSAWKLEGSADGQSWVTLDERSGQSFSWATQTRPFELAASAPYAHYRLAIAATSTGAPATLAEVELLSDPAQKAGSFALGASPSITGTPGVELGATLAILSGGESDDPSAYTATVDYLDGKGPQPGTLSKSPLGGWQISAPHTFADAGTYSARVTVTEGLNQATALATIVIARDQSLTASFDSVCISDPGLVGNCDELSYAYARQKLAATGFVQGTTVAVPGTALTFDLPAIPAGQPDNATGRGQTIAVDLGAGATQLSVIGTGTQKNQVSQGILTFTDGTTQTIDLNFGDWTGAAASPLYGNIVVGSSAGRLAGATGSDTTTAAIYATAPVTIPDGKTVRSLTLPNQPGTARDAGRIHVFAIASDGARTPQTPLTITPGASLTATTGEALSAQLATVAGGLGGGYTATVNWGDATATDAVAVAGGAVSAGHAYATAGRYTITVTADDTAKSVATTVTVDVTDAVTYSPTLTVSPGSVAPGAAATVTGSGFAPGERVVLALASTPAVTVEATADGDGAFTAQLTVPAGAADGDYPLSATGDVSAVAATATVTVKTAVIPPTNAQLSASAVAVRPGDTLTLRASGYRPGEQARAILHSDPTVLGTFTMNGDGILVTTVTIPGDAAIGKHSIELRGLGSGATASVAIEVVAALPVENGTAPAVSGYTGIVADTGSRVDSGMGAIALGLFGLGVAAVVVEEVVRRRRKAQRIEQL